MEAMSQFGRMAADCLRIRAKLTEDDLLVFQRVEEAALRYAIDGARREVLEVTSSTLAEVVELAGYSRRVGA